jgi:alpha-D-ribose 1-methylphosphonate 5-triphosphate synthase subunit PhnH
MGVRQELDLAHMQAGFDSPVRDAQTCFRAVLEALARPGQIQHLDEIPAPPAGLGAAQSAILLALADHDTPVWLPPALRSAAAGDYLRFHCGCVLATNFANACFVVVPTPAGLPTLDDLPLGEPNFPDRSATLLVEVTAFGAGTSLRLRGPGIADEATLRVADWTDNATALVRENRRRFPLGVDIVLTCGDRLVGLPRTVHLTSEGMACT